MKLRPSNALYACAIVFTSISVEAAPVTINISATIGDGDVWDSFATSTSSGDVLSGTFVYDTDEANASSSRTTPSYVEGHEFTSFYDFAGAPYAVSINSDGINYPGSVATAPLHIVVNNDLELTADETNGIISDGIYDWIEITGSTTSDYCPLLECTQPDDYIPADGQEWTLAIVASDTNWFTNGSVIPDDLPASYTPFLIGVDINAIGVEVGGLATTLDTIEMSAVPVPAAVWLFGSGLLGLVGIARRKKA